MSKAKELLQLMVEMARVGNEGNYSFWVYSEPLMNPTFHLKYKDEFEIVLQIKDNKVLEIKFNNGSLIFKKNQLPPTSVLNVVDSFLNSKNLKNSKITNKEMLDLLWDALNPKK